jgi:hypothetical protein
MKKALVALFALFMAVQAFGAYVVVLKDGTRYKAKAKWRIVNGKAIIDLETGGTVSVDPNLIDVKKSEEISAMNMGDVSVLGVEQATQTASSASKGPSLGSAIRLRTTAPVAAAPTKAASTSTAPAAVPNQLDSRVSANFERAYENIGIYEHKMAGTNRVVRAELTTDNEDRVFNAISATAFLLVRNAGVDSIQIDMVELFMKTTTGGAAGRFQMTREDAMALNNKTLAISDYYIRKVLY